MSSSYLLVRLRPVDPYNPGKRVYWVMKRPGIPATLKFEETAGWHQVPTPVGRVLRNEQDSDGKAVFDVCTHQEAIDLERAEEARRAQKLARAKASSPHDMRAMLTAKSAKDFAPPVEDERPAPAPRKAAPAPKPAPTPAAVVAPEDIDWDAIGVDPGPHPADEIQDERDDDDEPMELPTVDLAAEAAEEAPAPKRGRPRKR